MAVSSEESVVNAMAGSGWRSKRRRDRNSPAICWASDALPPLPASIPLPPARKLCSTAWATARMAAPNSSSPAAWGSTSSERRKCPAAISWSDTARPGWAESAAGLSAAGAAPGKASQADWRAARTRAPAAPHDNQKSLGRQPRGCLGEIARRPALGRSHRPRRKGGERAVFGEPEALAPGGDLLGRHLELGQRIIGRQGRAFRQRQRGAAVDHAGQSAFAPAQVVQEAEPELACKSGALGDARQEGGQGGLPGPRHDQHAAVAFPAQPRREGAG